MGIHIQLLTIVVLMGMGLCGEEIEIKTVMVPLPAIDQSYSVTQSIIYPKETWKKGLETDFFVKKALKHNPKAETEDRFSVEAPKKTVSDVPAKRDFPGTPAMPINLPQNTGKNGEAVDPRTSNNQIQVGTLEVNGEQKIEWKAKVNKPLLPFIIENGVQMPIVDLPPKGDFTI